MGHSLHYSIEGILFLLSIFAAKRNLIVFSTKADNAFTIEGFYNWKKVTEKVGSR